MVLTVEMKAALKSVWQKLMPEPLREAVRIARKRDDYIVLPKSALTFAEDGLYTEHAAPFLQDARFQRAYEAGVSTNSWHGSMIRWRAYVACWAAECAMGVEGDFVECGVNRGGLSRCIVEYLRFEESTRQFFLVDTYAGLSADHLTANEKAQDLLTVYAYYQDNSAAEVAKTFSKFPQVRVIEGAVPEILPSVPVDKVAYLSLDMNCVQPEKEAAEYFWDRISPGGIILHDDYGFAQHAAQRVMLDEFAKERGVSVLALPTGQGIIFKPASPSPTTSS